jgi:hypothetical protein
MSWPLWEKVLKNLGHVHTRLYPRFEGYCDLHDHHGMGITSWVDHTRSYPVEQLVGNLLLCNIGAPRLYYMFYETRKPYHKRIMGTNRPYGWWLWEWSTHDIICYYNASAWFFLPYLHVGNLVAWCCIWLHMFYKRLS